jgi:hypothetical protein
MTDLSERTFTGYHRIIKVYHKFSDGKIETITLIPLSIDEFEKTSVLLEGLGYKEIPHRSGNEVEE